MHLVFFREGTAMFSVNTKEPEEVQRYKSREIPYRVVGEAVVFDTSKCRDWRVVPSGAAYDRANDSWTIVATSMEFDRETMKCVRRSPEKWVMERWLKRRKANRSGK